MIDYCTDFSYDIEVMYLVSWLTGHLDGLNIESPTSKNMFLD